MEITQTEKVVRIQEDNRPDYFNWRERIKEFSIITLMKDGYTREEAEPIAVEIAEKIAKWHV